MAMPQRDENDSGNQAAGWVARGTDPIGGLGVVEFGLLNAV